MFRRHVIKELSSYIDNQLSEKDKTMVESHLESCKACSDELTRLKILSEKLKLWHAPKLEDGFDSSVKNKIVAWELERSEVKMRRNTLAILIPSSVLVGILVLVFVGQFYVKRGYQDRLMSSTEGIGGAYAPYYRESKDVSKEVSKPVIGDLSQGMYGSTVHTGYGPMAKSGEPQRYNYYAESFEKNLLRAAPKSIVAAQTEGSVIVIHPTIPATGEGEKIIRTGTVKLEVENGQEAYKKASEICQELGGYLAASQFYKDRGGSEAGTIVMRIPKDKFTIALDRLGALGKVENIGTDSQDVGLEYANLKAELEAAMVVYNKTLEALQKRQTTIPEAMRLESELTPVLRRIEDLKNRVEYLNNAVSFTTITVNFHEASVSVKALKESSRLIKESIISTGINAVKFLAAAVPVLVIGAILFGIAVAVVLVIRYWIIRIFKRG